MIGTLTLVLTSVFATGTAQAAAAPDDERGGHMMIMPSAPEGAGSAQALAAAPPTTSPAVHSVHVPPGSGVFCSTGNLCAAVYDPSAGTFKVFFFYSCNRYWMSNWNGFGEVQNSQTGGAAAYLYNRDGSIRKVVPADNGVYAQDWTPVWSLRNC
jgi:hypothetical protein